MKTLRSGVGDTLFMKKNKKGNIKNFLINHLEDFFILSGLTIIISTTFYLNLIAGLYLLGVTLFLIGCYLVKQMLNK